MEQYYGLTAEMYHAVVTLVDDRMGEIHAVRRDHDRLARGQERLEGRMDRVEAVLERLAEAQARTEERLERLEVTVQQLAEAQARTEERLEQLAQAQARTEERLEQLAQAQARTEERLEQLAQAQARTEERLSDLIKVVDGMRDTQGDLLGRSLELTYQRRVGAYFGPFLRRVRVISPIEIEDDLEPHLSEEEFRDLLLVDLLVRGRPRHLPDAPQVWLAVEISRVIDRRDVERAQRRAGHLRQAGYTALPAVAGERVTQGAEAAAQEEGVLLVMDGSTSFWKQALEQALAGE
jgi:hypothetical protein